MIIPINVNIPGPSSPTSHRLPPQLVHFGSDEVVLIEMQGLLEVDGNKDGQLVGKLRVDPATKKPTLLIGHHLLEGKLVNLSKPLAVLHRNSHDPSEKETRNSLSVQDTQETQPCGTASWDMVAIVKRKMVFSKRPMPMVGKPSAAVPLSRTESKT
ncbi:Ctf8-domain-containing protein [Trametes gibbosa]|nr:Ctf8-domain-containing protein [Trametes gibbosa]